MNDTFYETRHLSLMEKRKLLILAHDLCYDWHWDELQGGLVRKRVERSFEDILEGFGDDDMMVFILRREGDPPQEHIETGFTHLSRDGFLFININSQALEIFTETFELTTM